MNADEDKVADITNRLSEDGLKSVTKPELAFALKWWMDNAETYMRDRQQANHDEMMALLEKLQDQLPDPANNPGTDYLDEEEGGEE